METIKEKKYSEEFKGKAIELAQEIGSWKRFLMPEREEAMSHDLASALKEIKKLKKELANEKRSVSILREATAFFQKKS